MTEHAGYQPPGYSVSGTNVGATGDAMFATSDPVLKRIYEELRAHPIDPEFLQKKASELLGLGYSADALECQSTLVNLAPTVENRVLRARILANLGRWSEAASELDSAIELGGSNAELLRLKGTYLRRDGQLELSEQALRDAVSESSDSKTWSALGDLLLELPSVNEAIDAFHHASSAPGWPAFAAAEWNIRGDRLILSRRYADAAALFEAVLKNYADSADAWRGLAESQSAMGRPADALMAAKRACEANPSDARQWNIRGSASYSLQRFDDALDFLETSARLDTGFAAPRYNLALVYEQLDRLKDAITAAQEFIALATDDPDGFHLLATYHYALCEYQSALEYARTYLRMIKDRSSDMVVDTLNISGMALRDLGQYNEAIAEFDAAIKLKPTVPGIWFSKAICLLRMGEGLQADRVVQEITQRDDVSETSLWRCWASYLSDHLGQHRAALLVLERARAAAPLDDRIAAEYAEMLLKCGETGPETRRIALSVALLPLRRGMKCAMLTVAWACSAFENAETREGDFVALMGFYRNELTTTACRYSWNFSGLRHALRYGDYGNEEVRMTLMTLIDLQESRLDCNQTSYLHRPKRELPTFDVYGLQDRE